MGEERKLKFLRQELQTDLEKVYTVTDYYDGSRGGVAEFRGNPHYYECQFDESDDWSEIFLLKALDHETFQLVLEDWAIWERWNAAWEEGKVGLDTHPALPADKERHEEISLILKDRLKVDPEHDIRAKPRFSIVEPKRKGQSIASLAVEWTLISSDAI